MNHIHHVHEALPVGMIKAVIYRNPLDLQYPKDPVFLWKVSSFIYQKSTSFYSCTYKVYWLSINHYIRTVIVEYSWNVFTRKGVGSVANQKARFTDSTII